MLVLESAALWYGSMCEFALPVHDTQLNETMRRYTNSDRVS